MSINACQINGLSINALCDARRRGVIDSLMLRINRADVGTAQRIRPPLSIRPPFTRPEIDDGVDVSTLELPQVKVAVFLRGMEYFEISDRADAHFVPLIGLRDLKAIPELPESVSVHVLKTVPELPESVSVHLLETRPINDQIVLNITDIRIRPFDNEHT